MSLHYTPMGNSRGAKNQRVKHGQNQAVRQEDTLRDPERDRLKNSLHGENAHVSDCLVWNVGDDGKQKGSTSIRSPRKYEPAEYGISRENEFRITNYKPLPRHPELGRARHHLYGEDGPPNLHSKQKSMEGGVSDAMVGWPQERKLEEERQGRSGVGWEVDVREGKSPKMTRRNQRLEEGDSDAVMNDLMAHSYMRDNEERLQQLREQQMLDQVTVQRNRHTFRDNKASVLRAEAINGGGAGYGREDPKELWKMPRFTNAKSRLNDCPECKRHDCYHEDGRGFPNEPIGKKCNKGNCKGQCKKGMSDKGMGDKSGNRPQEEAETDRPCACCQQNHYMQEPEEYSYYEHQQPEKQSFRDDDYPRNGLFVL